MCVQEVVTHFYIASLLYKMGHYFLDILYISVSFRNKNYFSLQNTFDISEFNVCFD